MAASFDLVILHGPCNQYKKQFYFDELDKTHEILIPKEEYARDSSLGLCDILTRITQKLRQSKQIAVLDDFSKVDKIQSFQKIIERKKLGKRIALVHVVPRFGLEQLHWNRQSHLAECFSRLVDCCEAYFETEDELRENWILDFSFADIKDDIEDMGITIFHQKIPLLDSIPVVCKVPALFIEWEKGHESDQWKEKLFTVIQTWTNGKPLGRVFIIHETDQHEDFGGDLESSVISELSGLIAKLEMPLFVLMLNLKISEKFCCPPNPGILAFLQTRHCLNLHCLDTIYLYVSSNHMKLATAAGIRHMQMDRVLNSPEKVDDPRHHTVPKVPVYLQKHNLMSSHLKGHEDMNIPGKAVVPNKSGVFTCTSQFPGKQEIVMVKNMEVFDRYSACYKDHVSSLQGKEESDIHKHVDEKTELSNKSVCDRNLPEWMTRLRNDGVGDFRECIESHSGSTNTTAKWKSEEDSSLGIPVGLDLSVQTLGDDMIPPQNQEQSSTESDLDIEMDVASDNYVSVSLSDLSDINETEEKSLQNVEVSQSSCCKCTTQMSSGETVIKVGKLRKSKRIYIPKPSKKPVEALISWEDDYSSEDLLKDYDENSPERGPLRQRKISSFLSDVFHELSPPKKARKKTQHSFGQD